MALFQTSVLKKYLAQQDTNAVDKAYRKYTKFFLNLEIQKNIDKSNEEQIQATFLTELFVNVLDYTINPKPKYNLTTEYKNEKNNRKADGAIITEEKTVAVVELKGTNTKDLESIRRQAFDYKVNHKGCRFVITSNFEKLRFYIDDTTELLDFDLFNLTRDDFGLLYLCLYKDNLLKELPLQIKQDSLIVEEQITKEFYKDYSLFKRELYRDLVKKNGKVLKVAIQEETGITDNAEHQSDLERLEKNVKLTLFKKSQKLIDRFLFIFFAEDRGLLQPNYTIKRLAEWDTIRKLDVDEPLYDRFKKHFNYLDKGRKGDAENKEIFAYNGGLFKPDSILDRVIIDDDLLYHHTKKLATYDFESQVDVNILGHIFENSLNEIESINAEIEGGNFDKQKSKRKKDGVFYTPKYITKYIVENTVGKLCDEKKAELGFKEEEYFKGRGTGRKKRNDKTIQKLVDTLDTYRVWLLQITICDPACGSGAFLNQALDFLIKEHQYIDELKTKILGGGLQFPDIENTVLENNIYGVDLNEESVEIAKLSLWLRTAQPRRKLNDLSSNIKCGNSLIDSKTIAGDKAFNWETAFAKVFANGGFDVVIGNPPYVRHELFSDIKPYLHKNFSCYNSSADLYTYFFEKSIKDLIKQDGLYSIIVANKWMRANYGYELRKWLKSQNIIEIIDFKDLPVFADATAYPCIITIGGPLKMSKFKGIEVDTLDFPSLDQYVRDHYNTVDKTLLSDNAWSLADESVAKIVSQLGSKYPTLKDFINNRMFVGLKTGLNDAFIVDEEFYKSLKSQSEKYDSIVKPYGVGRDLSRYGEPKISKYIIAIPSKWTNTNGKFQNEADAWQWFSNEYPLIANHLKEYESRARKRSDQGNYWWELRACDYYNEFEIPKIVYPEIATEGRFTIDTKNTYFDMTSFIIGSESKELLGILNSKLISFIFKEISSEIRGGFLRWKRQYVYNLPIPEEIENLKLETLVSEVLDLKSSYNRALDKFIYFFQSQNKLFKLSKKLENWQDLDFDEFIKELNKAIKATNKLREKQGQEPVAVLTRSDEFEWLDLFEQNKKKAQDLQSQINTLEQQIDALVYGLYGLSDEEIRIVENG
ncbi:conserved hypothetical protein [Tenacibaculum maritimum]|uniref:Eco57I restriction-modification methylase domain-containing protein n=1 Tax=Tenacibaculum maritimum TaxID=107401 RepID=UPI0012E44835|nr:TaqI-like C-terminal specificity domain-containing protein [Tenacibaculum maritimum]CAA0147720.1 conserved hypothetical protein [Tenacibaculum maritimum]